MEALILATQGADTKSKQAAVETVLARLQKSPTLADAAVSASIV
jgi:hypothetical protein